MQNHILKPSDDIQYTKRNGFLYHDYMKTKIENIDLTIPKIIYQTHKSVEYIKSNQELLACYKSWDDCKQYGFIHRFYDDTKMDKFMRFYFSDIYDIFTKLPIPVLKADLFRYCVIYKYGGIYADMDTVCSVDPTYFLTPSLLVCFPENETHLCQWVFAAPPKSPLLKAIIDLSVERIKAFYFNNIKNEHIVHHLTGPGVFTDGIEKWLYENNLPTLTDPLKKNNRNMRNYFYYHKNILNVLRKGASFDSPCLVNHLFSGGWNDGWTKQRQRIL